MMRQRAHNFEVIALTIMAAGILMVWQPWSHALFRWGFFVTIAGVVSFMIAAHLPRDVQEAR
jgi:hypothetical protein